MKSGYYWCYTLDSLGEPLEDEGKPDIAYYNAERNDLLFIGYDMAMDYDPAKYQLLGIIEFQGLTFNVGKRLPL